MFDDERFSAFAFRLNTAVYKDSSGPALAARPLAFSERVRVMDPGEGTGRLRVKDTQTQQPLGWVERNSVLCNSRPTTDSRESGGSGLYKRVVVRTDTAVQGQVAAKMLYQTPDNGSPQERCGGACAQVSRFQWYFIYAEDNDHYLISEFPNLESPGANLIGWLPKADGYVWDTALGLRPDEKLAGPTGVAEAGSEDKEKYACVYSSPEKLSAAKPEDCNKVLGGMRWFGLDVRMAVIRQTERAYEVLFSNAETAGRDNAAVAEGLNNLDVFFVIDGTKSMQPAIDAMKKLTGQINDKMKAKTSADGGGIVRYGFRIYRDSNAKTKLDGVSNSEALPLSKTDCTKSNQPQFDTALGPVKAYDPDEDDDFSENTFGGLMQAADDIAGCPKNTKLVFVIGDAGYDAAKQTSRGIQAFTEQNIVDRFKFKRGGRFDSQPVVIFIQPPQETSGITNQPNYKSAYDAFGTQARSMLSKIYGGDPKLGSFADNFIRLNESANTPAGRLVAVNETLRKIDTQLNPTAIQAIRDGLRGGESLVSIIERLRNNSSLNIPIQFLDFADATLCSRVGDQCRTAVLEAVNHGFVPVDPANAPPKVVPEVLLSREQLDKWTRLLDSFKSFNSNTAGRSGRDQLVNTLLASVSSVMQLDMANDRVSMADKLQFQAGLPNAGRSPIMQYSDSDLRDVNGVPACEIENLKQYAIKKYDVLNIVLRNDGRLRPVYTETAWPEGACPMSPKGKNVPFIDGDVRPQALDRTPQTHYSLAHRRGQEYFFWLPVSYMP